jgi:hypothetical protein
LKKKQNMIRAYIGFDDTDNIDANRGTGKLARWFEEELPEHCRMWGVIRQQLLVHEEIPYTSHNSAACVMVDISERGQLELLIERAVQHIQRHSLEGSDPGVCVVAEGQSGLNELIRFGKACTTWVMTQKDAAKAAGGAHLSGHGGTNDGIIGAAAAVGLTASGWSGRFIEFGRLRDFPDMVSVSELERAGILVVSIDREATVPAPADIVLTKAWMRPRLLGNSAVLLAVPKDRGLWEALGEKRRKGHSEYKPLDKAAGQVF